MEHDYLHCTIPKGILKMSEPGESKKPKLPLPYLILKNFLSRR
jgi:hypothetical protein